jgi:hypothetical protein
MDSLDRRGQLPRAVGTDAVPEIEEGGATTQVGERDLLAVKCFERERRRPLVAERDDLERREQVIERVVRRGGRQQREAGQREREGQRLPMA